LRNEDEGAALSDGMFVWADPVSGVLLPRYVASTQQPAAKLMGQFRLVSFVRDPKMYAKMRF
jgi:hypothetical protein